MFCFKSYIFSLLAPSLEGHPAKYRVQRFLYSVVLNYYKYSSSENDQTNSIEMTELRQSGSDIVGDQEPCKTSGNSKARKLEKSFKGSKES